MLFLAQLLVLTLQSSCGPMLARVNSKLCAYSLLTEVAASCWLCGSASGCRSHSLAVHIASAGQSDCLPYSYEPVSEVCVGLCCCDRLEN